MDESVIASRIGSKFLGSLHSDEEILNICFYEQKIIIATNYRVLWYDSETEQLQVVKP